jgi:hypothetical protein
MKVSEIRHIKVDIETTEIDLYPSNNIADYSTITPVETVRATLKLPRSAIGVELQTALDLQTLNSLLHCAVSEAICLKACTEQWSGAQ